MNACYTQQKKKNNADYICTRTYVEREGEESKREEENSHTLNRPGWNFMTEAL